MRCFLSFTSVIRQKSRKTLYSSVWESWYFSSLILGDTLSFLRCFTTLVLLLGLRETRLGILVLPDTELSVFLIGVSPIWLARRDIRGTCCSFVFSLDSLLILSYCFDFIPRSSRLNVFLILVPSTLFSKISLILFLNLYLDSL